MLLGVNTQFTDCVTLEHFGPDHVLVARKCSDKTGFVCSKGETVGIIFCRYFFQFGDCSFLAEQTVKSTLVEDMGEPVALLPLNKALGSKDVSKDGLEIEDHFVGYSSLWAESQMIGYPLLAGQFMEGTSYIEIKSGPEKPVSGTGLTIMFWLKINQNPSDSFTLLVWTSCSKLQFN